MIRKARIEDIERVDEIYSEILDDYAKGLNTACWQRGVYPTRKTAEDALNRGDLFVILDKDQNIVGAAIINQNQVEGSYEKGKWESDEGDVMVLHTLVISPKAKGRGYGKEFVSFYEDYAKEHGCLDLRMDTNAKNTIARALYKSLGYKEVGIVPTVFNGIKGVDLVLLEKCL